MRLSVVSCWLLVVVVHRILAQTDSVRVKSGRVNNLIIVLSVCVLHFSVQFIICFSNCLTRHAPH